MHKRQVSIHTPCNVQWDSLRPVGSHRFCGACNKVVHDLSALSEEDARSLMRQQPSSLCVRYLFDEFGAIQFRPPALITSSRLTRLRDAAAVVAPLLLQACGGADFNDVPVGPVTVDTSAPCAAGSDLSPTSEGHEMSDADVATDPDAGAATDTESQTPQTTLLPCVEPQASTEATTTTAPVVTEQSFIPPPEAPQQ